MHNIQIPSDRNQSSKINQLTLKIDYLSEEIRTLSERNVNLEQILKLNQETMRTLKILDSSVQRSSYDITSTKTKANKSFPNIPILENLTIENKKLYEMLENISKECESLKSRTLVYEQIASEMERREEETRLESEKNIKKLTDYIQEKEKNVWKNDKIIDIDEENSFIIKYKHIIDPNEQTMILNQEINEYRKLLKQLYRLIKDLKSKNLDLTQTNYRLSKQIISEKKSKKTCQKRETISSTYLQNKSLDEFYTKLFEDIDHDNEFLSPLNSPLPEKIHINSSFNNKVPKLDLTKALKIQEFNAKRMFQNQGDLNKDNENKYIEKLKLYDNELTRTKKQLQREMTDNKILRERNSELENKINDLKANINIFKKSQINYDKKWKKIYFLIDFYQNIYLKYTNLVKLTNNKKEILENTSQRLELYEKNIKKEEKNGKNLNKTINDIKEDELHPNFSKKSYMTYLQSISKNFKELFKHCISEPLNPNEILTFNRSTKQFPLSLEYNFYSKFNKYSKLYRNNSDIFDRKELFDGFNIFFNSDIPIEINEKEFELSESNNNDESISEMFVLKRLDNPFLSNLNKMTIVPNKKKTMNFNSGIQERSNQSNESFEKKKLGNFSFMSNDEIFF